MVSLLNLGHIRSMSVETRNQELLKAVHEAGSKLLSLWPGGKPTEVIDIVVKEDGSPVSSADFESNAILTTALKKLFPGDLILSEEGPHELIPEKGRIWLIDPLDGTRGFIEGQNDFCILLSLLVDGLPQEGIVYFPQLNKLYASFLPESLKGCNLSHTVRPSGICVSGCGLKDDRFKYRGKLHSGLAFLKLVSGEIDAFVTRLNNPSEWDFAALEAVLAKLGGRVGNIDGGALKYSSSNWGNQTVVGSAAKTHDQILSMLEVTQQ